MGDGDIGARETIALMYHVLLSGDDVGPGVDRHYAVGVPAFRAQLDLCQRLGGAVVSARDWIDIPARAISASSAQVASPAVPTSAGLTKKSAVPPIAWRWGKATR